VTSQSDRLYELRTFAQLSKAWRSRWFGKNGELTTSCQNKKKLTQMSWLHLFLHLPLNSTVEIHIQFIKGIDIYVYLHMQIFISIQQTKMYCCFHTTLFYMVGNIYEHYVTQSIKSNNLRFFFSLDSFEFGFKCCKFPGI